MLKRARQHQIVERIFGSFPPSSFQPTSLLSSSSFSFTYDPSLFPISLFLRRSSHGFSFFISSLCSLPLFFCSLVLRPSKRFLCWSHHMFLGSPCVFRPSPIAPRRTIRPALLKLSLSASLPSCSVSRYLTGWLAFIHCLSSMPGSVALSRSCSRDSTPL